MPELILSVQFLNHLKARKSWNTCRAYGGDIKHFLEHCDFLHRTPQQMAAKDLNFYLVSLGNRRNFRNPKSLSRQSLARKMTSLSMFYKWLQQEELITQNPLERVERFRTPKHKPNFLTVEEVKRIRAMYSPEIAPLFEFLLSSGVRESEACGLEWHKVDLDKRIARVVGKGDKERDVLFSPLARELLEKLKEGSEFTLVFLNRRRDKLTPNALYYRIHKLSKIISRGVHPHLLRHTLATHMSASGVPLVEIQKLLGHEDISTTSRYAHPTGAIREAYDRAIEKL